nr:hypothetical protein [Anaerolineae bacterium]
ITDNDVAVPTDLLLNGGFELGREGQPTLARNWVVVAPSVDNDIRFCKAAPAPQIYEGTCAFRFSFSGTIVNGTSRSLTQTITAPAVSAGDSLTLTAYVRAANLINRPRLLVRAIYADGTSQRIRINIPEGTYAYTEFTGSVTLTGTPTSIVVIVQPRTSEGLFFVDGMSLVVNATPPARTSAPDSGLIPLPPAP